MGLAGLEEQHGLEEPIDHGQHLADAVEVPIHVAIFAWKERRIAKYNNSDSFIVVVVNGDMVYQSTLPSLPERAEEIGEMTNEIPWTQNVEHGCFFLLPEGKAELNYDTYNDS